MEKDYCGKQKLFYRVLKNIRHGKPSKTKHIKSKEGKIKDENKKIINRWKEYFEELLMAEKNITIIIEG